MAYHKTSPRLNIITVKDAGNTYQASWDGLKASSTAGPEQAAQALARKMLGNDHKATLAAVPAAKERQYRFKVSLP